MEVHTEQRMATMIAYTRVATSSFVAIPPILAWPDLRFPTLAAASAVGAVGEAVVVWRRLRRTGTTRDPVVLGVDVVFCLLLIAVGSRAADADGRGVLLTVLLPFALVCSALLGFGVRRIWVAALLAAVLSAGWAAALFPLYTIKIASDLLGFALWLVVARLIARELRNLARATIEAQADTARFQQELAQSARNAAVERERMAAHREIHDYLLPVVADVAADRRDPHVREAARQGLLRARRFLADAQPSGTAFRDGVRDLANAFPDTTSVIAIEHDPPHEIGEAVLAAAREALTNARRHGGGATHLYLEAAQAALRVIVRDRGPGFDRATTAPGGGLRRTFPAVQRLGGTIDIRTEGGTKVVIGWQRPDDGE
jgi:signal transduction histidine kinase